MALRAGGGPLVLRRALGSPGPVQGQRAFGAALFGARLASPLAGTVRMRAQDGAFSLRIAVGGTVYVLAADAGVFTLSGQSAALRADLRLGADGGIFGHTGQDAALRAERRLAADGGLFALTGQDAALRADRRLAADAGLFALAGQDAALRMARQLLAEAGVFVVSGQDVEFVVPVSAGAVLARFARRKAQVAQTWQRRAGRAVPVVSPAVRARLTIRGDDRL